MKYPITDDRWLTVRQAEHETRRLVEERENSPEFREAEAREIAQDHHDYEAGVYRRALQFVLDLLDEERERHP